MLIFVWNMQRAEKTHQREKHKKWSAPEREAHGIGRTCRLMEETERQRDGHAGSWSMEETERRTCRLMEGTKRRICRLMEEDGHASSWKRTERGRNWLVDGEDFVLLCYESEFYTKSPVCPSVIEKRKVW
jgi:hypothetical protein